MAPIFRGARAPVDAGPASTRMTAADIPAASRAATASTNKAVYPSATTENLARRAPTINGELVGPLALLAQVLRRPRWRRKRIWDGHA